MLSEGERQNTAKRKRVSEAGFGNQSCKREFEEHHFQMHEVLALPGAGDEY